MKVLKINGVEKRSPDNQLPPTLGKLLEQLDLEPYTMVAEIDGQIIEPQNFARTPLHDGQSIELVRFVGGGQSHG